MENSRKYIKLEKQMNKLKQKNDGLQELIGNQDELIDNYLSDNNNMKKSFYIILNSIIELQKSDITNEDLSESLSKAFNASLCGINKRNVEDLFNVDDIIDGYSISKKYSKEDVQCDCPNCSSDPLPKELIDFMEAEIFSSDEFQQFISHVMKNHSDEEIDD